MLSKFFSRIQKAPLLVGSVKSNIGHTELCAGLCAIAKIVAVLRTGVIPGNIHTDPIDMTLEGVKDGTLKVVLMLICLLVLFQYN